MPAPIAAFAAARSAECASIGGTPRVGPAFATPVDLNDDGAPDYIVDLAGIECANAWSAFCGSAGCPVSVWIAGPGGASAGMVDYAQGWSHRRGRGTTSASIVDRTAGPAPELAVGRRDLPASG